MRQKLKPVLCAVGTGLAVFLLFQFVFLLGYVPSASMEPTLSEGSFILGLRLHGSLEAGDIIVFRHDGELMVKRIAYGPGDEIDWSSLTYIDDYEDPPERETQVETVPEGCWIVLGDNTQNSLDSRYWDDPYVYREDIVAVVVLP